MMDLDFRLSEWARWARQRQWGSAQCCSMESRYRADKGETFAQEPKPLPVDARDAWAVECAWRGLPCVEKALLRAYYVTAPVSSLGGWEAHKRVTCRKLAIPNATFDVRVGRAKLMLGNVLR